MASNTLPQSLLDNPLLSRWVSFDEPGRARIASGKVEIGQGILTALTQIAAEELDLLPEQIRLVSGETHISPSEGFTSGSYSVSVGGASIRIVCAEVRELMLQAAAELLRCPAFELTVGEGKILRNGEVTGQDYWSVAPHVPLDRAVQGITPTKRPADYRIVGKSLPRGDLVPKLRGAGFIHDMAPADCLHARVLRQPWWDAQLVSFDESAVRKAARRPIEILREGSFVAFLSDEEFATVRAVDAAKASARWDGGRRVPDDVGSVEWLKSQPALDKITEMEKPGPAAGERVMKALYWRPFLTYGSIGPSCGLAEYKDGELKVWSHTQGPAILRDWIAKTLGLDPAKVTVFHRHGAGAYGHNSPDDAAFDAALVATRRPGRVVRVQWSREDEFTGAPISSAMAIELTANLAADGRPAEWVTEIWSPPHAQRPGLNGNNNFGSASALPNATPRNPIDDVPEARGGGATRNAVPLYDVGMHRLVHHMIPDLPLRTSSLRGLGAWANVFAIESFMDELAEAAGQNPVAYRLSLLSDQRARRVVEAAAAMSGFPEGGGPAGEGSAFGIGFAQYKNIAAYCAVVAEVEVGEEVRLKRLWCAADAGLVINPDGLRNQLEGGMVQGASFVLRESVRFEGGMVATRSWDAYPILRFSEVPEIEIELIDRPNEPTVGVGECGVGPAAAAIGNAVARALGTRIRHLPLTRERIMSTLLAEPGS